MKKEIIINATSSEIRVAITEDDRLAEIFLEVPDKERHVGSIYLGRVERVVQGMNAAFVDIGEQQDAFLHFSDVGSALDEFKDLLDDKDDEDDDDDVEAVADAEEKPRNVEAKAPEARKGGARDKGKPADRAPRGDDDRKRAPKAEAPGRKDSKNDTGSPAAARKGDRRSAERPANTAHPDQPSMPAGDAIAATEPGTEGQAAPSERPRRDRGGRNDRRGGKDRRDNRPPRNERPQTEQQESQSDSEPDTGARRHDEASRESERAEFRPSRKDPRERDRQSRDPQGRDPQGRDRRDEPPVPTERRDAAADEHHHEPGDEHEGGDDGDREIPGETTEQRKRRRKRGRRGGRGRNRNRQAGEGAEGQSEGGAESESDAPAGGRVNDRQGEGSGRGDRDRNERPHGEQPRGEQPHGEQSRGEHERGEQDNRNRQQQDRGQQDRPRHDDRQRQGSQRDDRPRDERPRDERPREDRPKDERPRDERPRTERPNEERPRDGGGRDQRTGDERRNDGRRQDDRRRDDRPREEQPRREQQAPGAEARPHADENRPRDDRRGRDDRGRNDERHDMPREGGRDAGNERPGDRSKAPRQGELPFGEHAERAPRADESARVPDDASERRGEGRGKGRPGNRGGRNNRGGEDESPRASITEGSAGRGERPMPEHVPAAPVAEPVAAKAVEPGEKAKKPTVRKERAPRAPRKTPSQAGADEPRADAASATAAIPDAAVEKKPAAKRRPSTRGKKGGDDADAPVKGPTVDAKLPTFQTKRSGEVTIALEKGQDVIVQVTRESYASKGVRVTTKVSLPGRFLVLLPLDPAIGISRKVQNMKERRRLRRIAKGILPEGHGCIIRTVAQDKDEEVIRQDLTILIDNWRAIEQKIKLTEGPSLLYKDQSIANTVMRDLFTPDTNRVVIDNKTLYKEIREYVEWAAPNLADKVELYSGSAPIFDQFGVEKELQKVAERRIYIPSGGYIILDQTEAMMVIDVNSGRYAGKKDQELNSLRTNLESAREIARQIRLRDIGGLLVIDFIDLYDEKNRKKVYDELKKEMRRDRAKSVVLPMTQFGLVQMTRQRIRQQVVQTISEPCPACSGSGLVQSKSTVVRNIERWLQRFKEQTQEFRLTLTANPVIIDYLTEGTMSRLTQFMLKYFVRIKVVPDESLPVDEFHFFSLRQQNDITEKYQENAFRKKEEKKRQLLEAAAKQEAARLEARALSMPE